MLIKGSAIEITADDAQDLGSGIGVKCTISRDPAREHVIHHHGGDGRYQAERCRKERFGDAWRHDREIRGV